MILILDVQSINNMNKKYIVVFFLVVIIVASFITIPQGKKEKVEKNQLSLEEAKEKILLTKKIELEKKMYDTDNIVNYPAIEDEETINDVISLLSKTELSKYEFTNEAGHDLYYLKFLGNQNQLIGSVEISSSIWDFQGDNFSYHLDPHSEDISTIRKIIKKEYNIDIP